MSERRSKDLQPIDTLRDRQVWEVRIFLGSLWMVVFLLFLLAVFAALRVWNT